MWSGDFVAELQKSELYPIYLLESLNIVPGSLTVAGEFYLTSAGGNRLLGYEPGLSPQGSSISAGLLNVGDWSSSVTDWKIGVDPGHGSSLRYTTTRGQPIALKVGFTGWDASEFQKVAIGQLQNIVREGERWIVHARSLLAGLTGRWTDNIDETALFYHLPLETFTDVLYTAGDSSITVGSSAGAVQETGKGYILEVTTDDGGVLFLHSTTLVGNVFSGLTILFDGSTTDEEGNTRVASDQSGLTPPNNNVRIGALVKGDPATIVRKVLLSTGTAGSNGTYDTLPKAMGLAFSEEHFDVDFFDYALTTLLATGASQDLYAYSFEPQENALAWLQSVLAPFGGFLCERQGQISISAMTGEDPPIGNQWLVTDAEIVSIDYETWNSNQPVEIASVRSRIQSETNGENGYADVTTTRIDQHPQTRPIVAEREIEFPYVNGTGESEWVSEAMLRTKDWLLGPGEALSVRIRGWRCAGAAPGDELVLATSRITGRSFDSILGSTAKAKIVQVDCDWFGSSTLIRAVLTDFASAAIDVP